MTDKRAELKRCQDLAHEILGRLLYHKLEAGNDTRPAQGAVNDLLREINVLLQEEDDGES